MAEVIDVIKNAILELTMLPDITFDEISGESLLMDLGLDSLTLVDLIVTLEDLLNIVYDASELDPNQLVQVQDLVQITEKHVAEKEDKLCGI